MGGRLNLDEGMLTLVRSPAIKYWPYRQETSEHVRYLGLNFVSRRNF